MNEEERAETLALHYLRVGRPADALTALRERGGVPSLRGRVLLAVTLGQLERYEEAREVVRDGLIEFPEAAVLFEQLCICEDELDNPAAAERAIRRAIELEPERASYLCRYGHVLARCARVEEASRVAELAERLDPGGEELLRLRLAVAYVANGSGAAAEHGRELLRLDPEHAEGHRLLAADASARGDPVAAARHMETVVHDDPSDEEAVAAARSALREASTSTAPPEPRRRFVPWIVGATAGVTISVAGSLSPAFGGMLLLLFLSLAVVVLVRQWRSRGAGRG